MPKNDDNTRPRDRWLGLDEAAFHAGVSPKTLRRFITSGKLPAGRVGRQIKIRESALEALWVPVPAVSDDR